MTVKGSPLGKDLLGLEELSTDQIQLILDTAEPFKEISERQIKKVPTLRGMTIAVDAGHGGNELGAIGPHGTLEKDANLAIARVVRNALEGAGAPFAGGCRVYGAG